MRKKMQETLSGSGSCCGTRNRAIRSKMLFLLEGGCLGSSMQWSPFSWPSDNSLHNPSRCTCHGCLQCKGRVTYWSGIMPIPTRKITTATGLDWHWYWFIINMYTDETKNSFECWSGKSHYYNITHKYNQTLHQYTGWAKRERKRHTGYSVTTTEKVLDKKCKGCNERN